MLTALRGKYRIWTKSFRSLNKWQSNCMRRGTTLSVSYAKQVLVTAECSEDILPLVPADLVHTHARQRFHSAVKVRVCFFRSPS